MDPQSREGAEHLEHENPTKGEEFATNVGISDDSVVYPVHLIPIAHDDAVFHGRKDTLTLISDHLNRSQDSLGSVLVHGLGGVGKTQTALEYARRNASKYDAIFWIQSETKQSINASITQIARGLGLPGSTEDGVDERNLVAFQNWQQAAKKNGRQWLIIFDNIEEIGHIFLEYVPTTGGSVIITSRHPISGLQASLDVYLQPFSVEDGAQFLKQCLKFPSAQLADMEDDERALKSLSKKVDGLPLALRAISGLMNARESMRASSFMSLYDQDSRGLLKSSARVVDYDHDESRVIGQEHVLDRIWRMSFEQLDDLPIPRLLLGVCSLLCPDGIPLSLLQQTSVHSTLTNKTTSFGDESDLNNAIATLTQMALIDYDGSRITIHRLVQEAYIHYHLDNTQRYEQLEKAFDTAVSILFQRFPRQVNGRPMHNYWKRCNNLIQHAEWLADRCAKIRSTTPGFSLPPNTPELLKSCAWFLFEMADYRTAISIVETSKDLCADHESQLYAHLLNTLGCCAFELNDLTTCRNNWNEALLIREKWANKGVPGAEEELANQLNNFGNLESGEGKYDAALELFDRAKEIRLKLGEEAVVPLGVSHMTTGRAYFHKGKYGDALKHYGDAKKIFLEEFGAKGHFMAHLNFAYGNLDYAQGKRESAKGFYELAQVILEENSPYHLLLAACKYKIACLEASANNKDAAFGDMARILKKEASILSQGNDEEQTRARILITDAKKLLAGRPDLVAIIEDNREEAWDGLTGPYYR
ncbi:P-loop containing nucleoside triphosphate hydrolase protein [Nemania sp. FL0031]|nr:P-loop containing nucleoside triphosphate hydrolase protein [Nemania sp. FL0031]